MDGNKFNIEEAFSRIEDNEVLLVVGTLSDEQQKRVEEKIFTVLNKNVSISGYETVNDDGSETKQKTHVSRKRFRKRMSIVLAAAIIALLGLSVGAAKGVWDFGLVDFAGISAQNIDTLDGSQSEIGASTTATLIDYRKKTDGEEVEVTFTITDSFGDGQQQFLEITTNYPAPEGFEPSKDVITPGQIHWNAIEKNGIDNGGGGSYKEEVIVHDGMLVFRISIREDTKSINKADMSLYFEELYLCKDAPVKANGELDRDFRNGELLLGGSWELTWTNNYETDTNVAMSEQLIVLDGIEVQVDAIIVSELGIRWEGHTTKDDLSEIEMDSVVAAMHVDYLFGENDPITIVYDDGSTIEVEHPSGLSVEKNGEVEYYVSVKEEDIVLDPEKVKSLNFHGVEILIP